jgi:hypothetical protein
MRDMLTRTQAYSVVLLRRAARYAEPDARGIIWEHGRRNFALGAEGKLPIVCPAADDSDFAGIGIFDATPDEVDRIMHDDPAVKAGLLTYELHPVRGFPSSALP